MINQNDIVVSMVELVNHDYDCDECNDDMTRRMEIVEYLKSVPQHEQKSAAWLFQRTKCLSATGVATAMDEDPYNNPVDLILDKCGRGKPFVENANVHHGKKCEHLGDMYYSFRNNVMLDEYGLIQHDEHRFIGASPDGICNMNRYDGKGKSKLAGRLLEIKFPKVRKIVTSGNLDGDICPHYYYLQVQTQLFVTGLDECDFLQCELFEYDSWDDYIKDTHADHPGLSKKTGLEKGCLIQLFSKAMAGKKFEDCLYSAKYMYPPKLHMTPSEIKEWIADVTLNYTSNPLFNDYYIERILYWRFNKVACNLIRADTKWMESKLPFLKQFWRYVLFYKNNPEKLDKLCEYLKAVEKDETKVIFEYIHKDYLTKHPSSKSKPLYTEENEWRKKYNEKKRFYRK